MSIKEHHQLRRVSEIAVFEFNEQLTESPTFHFIAALNLLLLLLLNWFTASQSISSMMFNS
jgi:hypothetical protein